MRALARSVVLLPFSFALLGFAGCGSDDSSSPADTFDAGGDASSQGSDAASDSGVGSGTDGSLPDAGPAPFVSLIGRSTTISAGPNEGYFCTAIQTTAPMDITAFHVEATANIVEATLTAGFNGPAGDSACTPGTLGAQLLYAFSAGTSELDFPAGTAMHVEAQGLVLNLHVDNETASTANDTVDLKIRTTPTTPTELAQAFYLGTRTINIPNDGVTHTATGGCSLFPTTLNIFAVTPMMYRSATHAKVTSVHSSTTTTLFDGAFDFANQATHPLSPAAAIKGGDDVELVCSYVNNTGAALGFGDYTSNAEHCFAATYAYGIGALGIGMFQCAN